MSKAQWGHGFKKGFDEGYGVGKEFGGYDFFPVLQAEKDSQVNVSSFLVYGIKCESRYRKVVEFVEMLVFLDKINDYGLIFIIENLFYDSQATICNIVTKDLNKLFLDTIFQVAVCHFTQFSINGEYVSGKLFTKRDGVSSDSLENPF